MDSENKSYNGGNKVLILIAMVMGVVIGLMFGSHQKEDLTTGHTSLQGKMSEVLDLVESRYVDSVDADSLSERLVGVMLSELDPHSVYLTARETERTSEMMRGNFEGVGLVLRREGDSTYIGQVLADGPSAGSGLLPGDLIVRVDGVTVSGVDMPADSVVARLRGPRRSKVKIEIQRHSDTQAHGLSTTLDFIIRRGVVNHKSLSYSGMLDDTTGYIMLSTFSSTSHDEFHDALRELVRKGMKHLIFDLRGNTGGSLESAVGIANELLPANSLIVYTQGAHQRRNNVYARRGGLFTEGRVTVMVDESSASASEVVSGALQDNDRALIVGRSTFGKGLVSPLLHPLGALHPASLRRRHRRILPRLYRPTDERILRRQPHAARHRLDALPHRGRPRGLRRRRHLPRPTHPLPQGRFLRLLQQPLLQGAPVESSL